MSGKFLRITTFFLILGMAQAAVAFCPIGSVKKAKRPPMQMQTPVAPVMAWMPAQPIRQQIINGQPMVLVPVYPTTPVPAYYGYPR